MVLTLKRFSKAIAALLGTATPAGIIGIAAALGWDIPMEVATAVVAGLGVLATVLAPANAEKSPAGDSEAQELISPETHPELYESADEYVGQHRAPCEECPANNCEGCPLR